MVKQSFWQSNEFKWLQTLFVLWRNAFFLYSVAEMAKEIMSRVSHNPLDNNQITIRLPSIILAKLERLAAHAVQTKSQFLIKLLQDVPDVEGENSSVSPPQIASLPPSKVSLTSLTPLQERICTWFRRRPSTRWTLKETRAYRENAQQTPPEDVEILERYYTAKIPGESDYRRKDLSTLLNNWPGELDRARTFVEAISRKRSAQNARYGWISANVAPKVNEEASRNLTPDEVKAGVAELRSKMGLPLEPKEELERCPLPEELE